MSKPKLFVCGITLVLLLASCGQSGATGTWITFESSPRFGTWLVISDDGTFTRETETGTLVENEEGLCLDVEGNSVCNPIVIDGDQMTVDFFGREIEFQRINAAPLESPKPNHELVGQWEWIGSNGTIDYLPNGEFVFRDIYGDLVNGFWSVDGNIYCEVTPRQHQDLISRARIDGNDMFPTWKGDCEQIEIMDLYAEITRGGGDGYTLRKVSP